MERVTVSADHTWAPVFPEWDIDTLNSTMLLIGFTLLHPYLFLVYLYITVIFILAYNVGAIFFRREGGGTYSTSSVQDPHHQDKGNALKEIPSCCWSFRSNRCMFARQTSTPGRTAFDSWPWLAKSKPNTDRQPACCRLYLSNPQQNFTLFLFLCQIYEKTSLRLNKE